MTNRFYFRLDTDSQPYGLYFWKVEIELLSDLHFYCLAKVPNTNILDAETESLIYSLIFGLILYTQMLHRIFRFLITVIWEDIKINK